MTLLLLLEMVASTLAGRTAVGPRDGGMTYEELLRRAGTGAAVIGDRGAGHVAYLGTSHAAWPVALFAAAWAGVPLVPLSYRLSDEALHDLLARLDDVLVVADEPARVTGVAAAAMSVGEWMHATGPSPAGRSPVAPAPSTTTGDDVAVLLPTSGTTSTPKTVILRHRHLVSYVLSAVEAASAAEDDAALVSVPPYHVAGVANIVTNVYRGRRLVYLPDFTPAGWLDTVRAEGITNAMVVPTMLARVVDHLDGGPARCPTLRALSYGGSRMPPSVLGRALDAFPDTDFVNAYGLTETSSTLTILGPGDHRAARDGDEAARRRLASVGRPVPGVEIEVRDGEIWVRGEQVSGEYLGGAAQVDADGWFPTRDRGWIDDDGYLFVEGRVDDTIIRGGENIAPAEVEDALLTHPAVADAAVVGVADEEWGQRLVAVVVPRDGGEVDVEEVRAHVRERVRSSRTPDVVLVRPDLPRTDTGKLLRRRVLADVEAEVAG